jgi:hypothetical protein
LFVGDPKLLLGAAASYKTFAGVMPAHSVPMVPSTAIGAARADAAVTVVMIEAVANFFMAFPFPLGE